MTPRNLIIGAIFAALIARIVWLWWPREERALPVDWERVDIASDIMRGAARVYDAFYDEAAE